MRKLYTLLIATLTVGLANAQTNLFFADFEDGIPSTMTQDDRDGLTPHSSISQYGFSTGTGWVGLGGFAISTSYYNPAGTSDDWLITPEITIQENTYLSWGASSANSDWKDGYSIYLIEGTTETEIYSKPEEDATYVERFLNLSDHAGKTAKIAFVNNSTDMYLLFLNDISIDELSAKDATISDIKVGDLITAKETAIGATIKNVGHEDIDTVVIKYTVGTESYTQKFHVDLGMFDEKTVYFWKKWDATLGSHNVIVEVLTVDGTVDDITDNNSMTVSTTVKEDLANKVSLFEVGTSITCPPCATYVPPFMERVDSTNRAIAIAYQGEYNPNHTNYPMYTFSQSDVDSRISYYGLEGWPSSWINGIGDPEGGGHHPANVSQSDINESIDTVSNLNICIAHNGVNANTNEMTVTVTVTALDAMEFTVPKLRIALTEDEISYIQAPGTNGEKHFTHVMRDMLPSASGTLMPTEMAKGENFEYSETVTIDQNTIDINHMHIIAFVQDDAGKLIEQANITKTYVGETASETSCNWLLAGVDNIETELFEGYNVYPTVAQSNINITLNAETRENAIVKVYNSLGQIVYQDNMIIYPGMNNNTIDVSSLHEGNYIIETISGTTVGRNQFQIIR